ncbi:MAG: MFS transporter [Planctomycetes bacterium]|nr:MFS transporter [Planctomycetota bacterium]
MRLWRYCLAGFLFNWLGFVFWFVIPVRAVGFHATSTQLALLQTTSTVFYVANCLFIGSLSDRVSRALLARLACVGAFAACALAVAAKSLGSLYLVVPLLGIAGSVFWPSVQGALGAEAGPSRVEKVIGWFNVSWSTGKAAGFVLAGWLVATYGSSPALWIAAAAALPILLLYPGDKVVRWEGSQESAAPDRAAFRTIGYVANFLAFGIGAVFQSQFFKYLEATPFADDERRKVFFGTFLGTMYATQTVMFVILQRGAGWTYRRSLLYGAQLLCGAAASGVTFLHGPAAVLGAAAMVGVGLGFANASSIYYSLHGPADHGKYAGLHEAVLGTGTVLVPLAGGLMADHYGDLRMPYWLAGAATLAAILAEEAVYRSRPRS